MTNHQNSIGNYEGPYSIPPSDQVLIAGRAAEKETQALEDQGARFGESATEALNDLKTKPDNAQVCGSLGPLWD